MSIWTDIVTIFSKLALSVLFGVLSLFSPLLSRTNAILTLEPNVQIHATSTSSAAGTATHTATTTPKKVATPPPVKKIATTPTQAAPTPPPPPPPAPISEDLNASARATIVNILCTTKYGDVLHPITASGVFIDSRGVILANAHVGQYLLLKDYLMPNFVECVARTGSPATPMYKLGLLYISPAWVRDNASQLTSSAPVGTGENDFAFLYVTGRTNPDASLPASFPAARMDTSEESLRVGASNLVAAYPAGFLGAENILKDLYLTSAFTTIKEIFTFDTSTVDVISIGGSVVAQKGSSGGGVFSSSGSLIAIVTTSTDGATTDIRDLRAITLGHINRSLSVNSGSSLPGLLSGDIVSHAAAFQTTIAPTLTMLLEAQLQ